MADKPAELPTLPDHVISAFMPDETRPLHTLLDQIKSLSLDFDANTPKSPPDTSPPPPATETPRDALDRLKAMFEAREPPAAVTPPAALNEPLVNAPVPIPPLEEPREAPLVEAPSRADYKLAIARALEREQKLRTEPLLPEVIEPPAEPTRDRRRPLRWALIGVPAMLVALGLMMPGQRPEVAVATIPPILPPAVVGSLEVETQQAPAPAEPAPTSVDLAKPTEPREAASQPKAEPPPAKFQALIYIEAGDEQISKLDIVGARSNFWNALQASMMEPKVPALGIEAAIRLGATYDPSFLKRAGIKVKADAAKAKFWYRWAGH